MVILSISNSYSSIKGLDVPQERELKALLSYTIGSYAGFYTGGYGPKKVSLLSKRCDFPTGLLERVMTWLEVAQIKYKQVDKRIQPIAKAVYFKLPVEPYEAQKRAVKAAIESGRGIITMPTGSGKSYVIGLICAYYGLRTLIVVPNLEIKKQLTEGLKTFLPANAEVYIENIDSPKLKNLTDIDVLIIDEAHHVAAKTYRKLNRKAWTKAYYRFFLTATPFRNDTEETLLFESIAGRVIYELTYQEAVEQKLIVPVEAYFIDIPKQQTDAYTWAEVYSQLVVGNSDRNFTIAELMVSLTVPTLCLVKEVAHGKKLSELTGYPFANGTDEDSRRYIQQFNRGEITHLIGTEGILSEGVDTKPCEFVIIAGLGKAKSAFQQKVGRAVRTYPGKESAKVVIFRDKSHKFLTRHFKAQCDILNTEYGIKPIKLEFE